MVVTFGVFFFLPRKRHALKRLELLEKEAKEEALWTLGSGAFDQQHPWQASRQDALKAETRTSSTSVRSKL